MSLDQITGEGTDVREALDEIIEEFQTTEALGSLLDVQSTLQRSSWRSRRTLWIGAVRGRIR